MQHAWKSRRESPANENGRELPTICNDKRLSVRESLQNVGFATRFSSLLCSSALFCAGVGCADDDAVVKSSTIPSCARSWKRIRNSVDVELRGVWARSPSEVWAAGTNGVILKCDQESCELVDYGLANIFEHVRSDGDAIYAAGWVSKTDTIGSEPRIYRKGAEAWSRYDPGFDGQLMDFWAFPDTRFVLSTVVKSGRFYVERGGDWNMLDNPFDVPYAAWGTARNDMYIAGRTKAAQGAVYRLTGSSKFERVTDSRDDSYTALFGIEHHIFVGGSDQEGRPLIGQLDGSSFVPETIEGTGIVRSIFGSSMRDLWAVAGGQLRKREDQHWKTVALETGTLAYSGFGLDSEHTYIVGPNGAVLRYDCDAAPAPAEPPECEWESSATIPERFTALWGSTSGSLLVTALRSISSLEDGGQKTLWTGSGYIRFHAMSGIGDTSFAVGVDTESTPRRALVVRCVANECERMDTPFDGTLIALHAFAPDSVFAVGIDDNACGIITHYDGHEWTPYEGVDCVLLQSIWGSSATDIWAAGMASSEGKPDFGRILHFDGKKWSVAVEHAPIPLVALTGRDTNEVYAVGIDESVISAGGRQFGTIMHWDGHAWTELIHDEARGFTYATMDDAGALWVGALRRRPVERDALPEIARLYEGTESVTHLCNDARGRVVGMSRGRRGYLWTVIDQGRFFTMKATD